MTTQLTIKVDGPFSLAAAASFGFGPTTGRPFPDAQLMRLDFVADDLQHHVGVALTQPAEGVLEAEVSGEATLDSAERQIRRILSIDTGVAGWLAAGQADPVLGAIQAENPDCGRCCFTRPTRPPPGRCCRSGGTGRGDCAAPSSSGSAGVTFELAGQSEPAFPLPQQLLEASEFRGIEEARLARLHGVARAALDGQLDPRVLRAMPG